MYGEDIGRNTVDMMLGLNNPYLMGGYFSPYCLYPKSIKDLGPLPNDKFESMTQKQKDTKMYKSSAIVAALLGGAALIYKFAGKILKK